METADFYRDKRILIFGASGGLGQELARQLALRGRRGCICPDGERRRCGRWRKSSGQKG